MKVVIIDDVVEDLEYPETLLQKNFGSLVTECNTFTDPEEGLKFVNDTQPRLLILDMEMPGISGLDLLQQMKSARTEVVFATSHDSYALDAFKSFALGFLHKPYSEEDFVMVMTKTFNRIISDTKNAQYQKRRSSDVGNRIVSIPKKIKQNN